MSSNSIKDTFFEECEELLEALVEGLAQIEDTPDDMEAVNAVFRAVHSIKGGAGAFALDQLVEFAHTFETVMDKVRGGELAVDDTLMALFHRAGYHLSDLVAGARDETAVNDEVEAALITELEGYLGKDAKEEEFSFDALTLDFTGADAPPAIDIEPIGPVEQTYSIALSPTRALYENGHEPLLLFDALAELGTITVTCSTERLPDFDAMDPSDAYLDWQITLKTTEPEDAVKEVFEFVDGLCTLSIEVMENTETESGAQSADQDVASDTLCDTVADTPASFEPVAPDTSLKAPKPSASQAPEAEMPSQAAKEPRGPKPTLRVDLDRVDRLINTVGELIINQAMISQRIEELDLPTVSHLTNELESYKLLARDIQEGVMAIRAQPVKPLFQRMSRIVREASDATGKRTRLVTVGDSTEVDKTVIERLADPLTHMIRNAVDHGIESHEARLAAGKDAVGTIRLSAAHRSGSVFIEIADDGAGLNRETILAKAIEKNLIPADAELSEPEIDNLLFLPGFSTAGKVSNLSGRGVGMDVVKNAVQALGGRVSITSQPGKGTTFTIILPLTLAVMDGFIISVGAQTMVIPIASILETIRPKAKDIHTLGTDTQVVSVRGSYVPIINVAERLALPSEENEQIGILLLVSSETNGMIALQVTAIHDQRQVVIKSLESNYAAIPGVSAATILGNGRVALILDPEELIKLTQIAPADALSQQAKMELRHV